MNMLGAAERNLSPDELTRRLKPSFQSAGFWHDDYVGNRHAWFQAVLELLRPRAKRLEDFVVLGRFFFVGTIEHDERAVARYLAVPGMRQHLRALDAAFAEQSSFDAPSAEVTLRTVADARSEKAAALIHAVRVAVTGQTASPGLFEVLALLGRQRTRQRLAAAFPLAGE